MAVGGGVRGLVFLLFVFMVLLPGAGASGFVGNGLVPLDCSGSTVHYCDDAISVYAIDAVSLLDVPVSSRNVSLVVDWTGWHYTDPNHWAFFLDDGLNPVGTCVSFLDDSNVNTTYSMSCSVNIPYDVAAGLHNLTVTANDAYGYCTPGEDNVDAQYTIEMNVTDPPVILRGVQCLENGTFWEDCSSIAYGDVLTGVRVNCSSLNSTIVSASFSLENMPDLNYFFQDSSNTSFGGGMAVYDNTDIPVRDSGEWNLTVVCADSAGDSTLGSVSWTVPWGRLEGYLISPSSSINTTRYRFFNFSSGVLCLGGECGDVNATLDPEGQGGWQACSGNDTADELPVMKPDAKELKEMLESYNKAKKISASPESVKRIQSVGGSSFSLLSHLNYNPVERNQGRCGNCWLWACTGVTEVALDVQNGIFDRLSTQYMNSYETVLFPSQSCCQGGLMRDYVKFFNITRKAVPWSNLNAYYQDGDGSCDTDYTTISTTPNYHISNIEELSIPTLNVSSDTAIANIKNVLLQDKAVYFAFYLPEDSSWADFRDFWLNRDESAVYNMDKFCGIPYAGGGGHAVLLVGYNDTDPGNRYWVILNSWSANAGRPNGLFRINMSMDYNCSSPFPIVIWETLNVSFDFTDNKGVVPVNEGTPFYTISSNPQHCGRMGPGDSCNQSWLVNVTGYPDTTWNFFTIYAPDDYSSFIQTANTNPVNVTITTTYLPQCHMSRCDLEHPCYSGFGDCDGNSGCVDSTCTANVGLEYGCQRWVDVCVYTGVPSSSSSSSSSVRSSTTSRATYSSSSSSSTSRMASTSSSVISSSSSSSSSSSTSRAPTTTIINCGANSCTPSAPCPPGYGDCDSNAGCVNSTCTANVGLEYGCQRWVDVCA
ncbi:MAG: C1 family peptidase [Candidatus Altiarchaeota archaeon]|nr:C1 family peptidase [Candidatus Altiarchaeota archaeon]